MNQEPVTHDEFDTMFEVFYRSKEPLFLHGNIGIGKSQHFRKKAQDIARKQDRQFVVWADLDDKKKSEIVQDPSDYFLYIDKRMAEAEPTDLKGLPDSVQLESRTDLDAVSDEEMESREFVVDEESGEIVQTHIYTKWQKPMWAAACCAQGASGIVLLDEANLAPNLIQSVFYQLVLDRKISNSTLADDVYVAGAGNIAGEDEAHINPMAAPLRDRFAHLRLKRPEAGRDGNWTEWAAENDIDSRILGFLASSVGQRSLYTFGTQQDSKDSMAFATPRSWEKLSNLLKSADQTDLVHEKTTGEVEETLDRDASKEENFIINKYAASLVGTAAAEQFAEFVEQRSKFDVDKYIDDPSKMADLNDKKVNEAYASLTAIATSYENEYCNINTVMEMTKFIDSELAAYLIIMCSRYSDRFGDEFAAYLDDNPDYDSKELAKLTVNA